MKLCYIPSVATRTVLNQSEWLVTQMLYMFGLRTCVELYIVGLCLHFSKYGQCLLSCQCFHASLSFHLDVQGDSYNAHSCWPLSSSSELSPGSQALYKLIQTHGSSRVPLCQSIPCCVCNCLPASPLAYCRHPRSPLIITCRSCLLELLVRMVVLCSMDLVITPPPFFTALLDAHDFY